MKPSRLFLITAFVLGISTVAGATTTASQEGPAPEAALFGGGQFGSPETKSGAAVLGSVGIRFMPYFALDIQGGWLPTTSKQKNIAPSDLSITSLEVIPRIYAPLGHFEPYLGAGPARFFVNERLNGANPPGAAYSEDVDSKWGGVFGGGVDLAINENISFGLDVSYLYLRSTVHATTTFSGLPTTAERSVNLDAVRVLGGIRVKFVSPGWMSVY